MDDHHDSELLDAGTVVCLRHHKDENEWQVLLGQSHVKNWLRSTKEECVIMRFAGEWKFPGGVKEDEHDATIQDTAIRELCEEFIGIEIEGTPILHPMATERITRPVRGKRYRVYTFVAYAHECSTWLNDDTEGIVNAKLQERMANFERLLEDGMYYGLTHQEKQLVSPELHRVRWIALSDAIHMLSTADSEEFVPVDEWQQTEFNTYNLKKRDSMYQTKVILEELLQELQ